MSDLPPCRFCGAEACGVYYLNEGCFCYPEDREQALCPQHVIRATPLDTMELVRGPGFEEYTKDWKSLRKERP